MSAPVDVVTPPPIRPSCPSQSVLCWAATALAVLVAGHWAGRVALNENHHEDLWIYSSGSWFAFHGQTPYDVPAMHARVDERYAGDENLDGNNGFFLTPQALLVMAPFAALPWEASKVVWCAAMVMIGAGIGWRLRFLTDRTLPAWFTAAAVVFVLLNWLSMFVLIVGQTPLLTLGCVVFGQAAYRKGWKRVGCLLWAVAFIKPHLALPLIPLAWYLSGWKRAAEVVAWAAVLNVAAGLVFYGNPLFVLDYLAYVQQGHQTVEFNRVGVNKQITAWNRLIVAGGGPVIELGMLGTVAGYLVFSTLVAARVWLGKRKPTTSWAFAVAACGALACCQVLPYELPLLALTLPYLGELLTSGRRADKIAAGVLLAVVTYTMLPGGDASDYYRLVRAVIEPLDATLSRTCGTTVNLTDVLLSHRSLGTLAIAAGVVGYGPPRASADRHFRLSRLTGVDGATAGSASSVGAGVGA